MNKSNSKAKAGKSGKANDVIKKVKNAPRKFKIVVVVTLVIIVVAIVIGVMVSAPVSKSDAANIFAGMMDRRNEVLIDTKNDAATLDITKLRADAEGMVKVLEENIKLAEETKWPEGLGDKTKRLSGENLSDMDILISDMEKERDFYQRVANASDDEILSVYSKEQPYTVADTDDFRKKLGLPSKMAEKSKYHEYTEDEITEKLQETAVEVNLGKFNIECKDFYGHTQCSSSMDLAVRNKSGVNFANGGSVDVTAYDQSGNPIDTDTVYLGNRLEKGQTAKSKIFEYVREENRSDFQNNPTFKVTKVNIYNY